MKYLLVIIWGAIVGFICDIAGYGWISDDKFYPFGAVLNTLLVVFGVLIINMICEIWKNTKD